MKRDYNSLVRALASLALCVPGLAIACDCASTSLLARLANSDAVFLGEVVAHQPQNSVEFEVIEVFKSAGSSTIRVDTRPAGDCDYTFKPAETQPGDRYLVFMSTTEAGNRLNLCLGTAPAASATEEAALLRHLRGM